MVRAKAKAEKDLFGNPVKKRKSKSEILLERIDRNTFQERVKRLKYLESISPGNFGMTGSIEPVFIFHEAGWAYLNGAFIATIILSQAFIERRLQDFMTSKGLEQEAKRGVQFIISYCRKHQLINDYLLDKIDHLRQTRNPLAHLKPYDHPFTLGQRTYKERKRPDEILEREAKEALSLMYTILFTRLP
jgi:hypothetical protein